MTPGQLHQASTLHSIGLEWDIVGDSDRDARGTVQFRVQGSTTWKPALPLIRVDLGDANTLAGSILFLAPERVYEVKVDVSDPDGGTGSQTIIVDHAPRTGVPDGRTNAPCDPRNERRRRLGRQPISRLCYRLDQCAAGDTSSCTPEAMDP